MGLAFASRLLIVFFLLFACRQILSSCYSANWASLGERRC